jgi:hypothetical protein
VYQRWRGGVKLDQEWIWTVVVVDKNGKLLTPIETWRGLKYNSRQPCEGKAQPGECQTGWQCVNDEWVCPP